MYDYDEENDGRFPDESPVEVRYPRSKEQERGDREQWPWLPGTIVEGAGPVTGDRVIRSAAVQRCLAVLVIPTAGDRYRGPPSVC
jgi:hypothetical protein